MKKQTKISSILLSLAVFLLFAAKAEAVSGTGSIRFEGEYIEQPVDPEKPGEPADPGPSPSTTGDLRIDFVPTFNFWSNKISDKDQTYLGNAQLFHGETGTRGNYVQISDFRGTNTGWLLQVRQETQFRNETTKNKELNGAAISLDQSWTNSTWDKALSPIVSKEVIRIDNIGETYNLAKADPNTGMGTWTINFGASVENDQGRKDTLIPRMDEKGNPILDSNYENKPIYQNEALSLFIPGATKKDPVAYQTVLTWILSELP